MASRTCAMCGTPTVEQVGREQARIGITSELFECTTCGHRFRTFTRGSLIAWFLLAAGLVVGMVYAFASGRVEHGDGPMILVLGALLVSALVVIGVRAVLADRRNPRT